MKVACIIATRGRPHQAIGVIESIRLMSSGEHEIEFIVACDDDDPAETAKFMEVYVEVFQRNNPTIRWDCAPRPTGVAACWNRCTSLTDAEVLVTLPDDCLIGTPHWDEGVSRIWRNHPWAHADLKIGAFNDTANPGQATAFIIGRRWIELMGLFDERYPMWFADTAISETYSFIVGQGMPILPINLIHKPGEWNPRLKEMPLWWRHYGLTRKERLETARKIRKQLDLPEPPNLGQIIEMWEERDRNGLPASEEIVRQIISARRQAPMDDRYLTARSAAIAYLEGHGVLEFSGHEPAPLTV